MNTCVSVSGTVVGSSLSHDGDYHVLVRLDAGQTCGGRACLNGVNASGAYGDLVVEIVCAVPAGVPECSGYQSPLAVPPDGTHTVVTGPWVMDKSTGWNEIHPVESF